MLLEYVRAALTEAKYKILEDGTFHGEISGFPGLWANEPTLEQCREELQSALEDWLLLSLRLNHQIPVVRGLDLNQRGEAARTGQVA
ncbi:MAG: type II toxin-antitoxin system HicB family antitoxin [Planctomycetota bacterium]|nr:type II toxin-antitoxin system HicB family antitoxin [Planctomycetota bacterium]